MFGIFKTDPAKKLRARYDKKVTEAMNAQRGGNIDRFASLTAEAEAIARELEAIEAAR